MTIPLSRQDIETRVRAGLDRFVSDATDEFLEANARICRLERALDRILMECHREQPDKPSGYRLADIRDIARNALDVKEGS